MILKHFRRLGVRVSAVLLSLLFAPAAAGNDVAFISAFDAYRAGDAVKFARVAKPLEGHLLEPWIEYWRDRKSVV